MTLKAPQKVHYLDNVMALLSTSAMKALVKCLTLAEYHLKHQVGLLIHLGMFMPTRPPVMEHLGLLAHPILGKLLAHLAHLILLKWHSLYFTLCTIVQLQLGGLCSIALIKELGPVVDIMQVMYGHFFSDVEGKSTCHFCQFVL